MRLFTFSLFAFRIDSPKNHFGDEIPGDSSCTYSHILFLEVHALPVLELNNRVFIFSDNLTIYIKIQKKKKHEPSPPPPKLWRINYLITTMQRAR